MRKRAQAVALLCFAAALAAVQTTAAEGDSSDTESKTITLTFELPTTWSLPDFSELPDWGQVRHMLILSSPLIYATSI